MSRRRERLVLAGVVFGTLLAQVLLYPGIPDIVRALGATNGLDASTWFLGVEFASFVAFVGVWGAVSDRTGRRVPFIAASAFSGSACYALLAGLNDAIPFAGIVALRALQGALTVGAFSLAITMLADLSPERGRNMGTAGVGIGLGTAIGAPLGGQLADIDPLLPLWAGAVALALVGLLALLVSDRAPDTARSELDAVRAVTRRPGLLVPYAFGFIDRFTAGFFALVGTYYFRDVFGLDGAQTGLTLALFFAPFAVLQYPFGLLADRIGRTLPIAGGSALYGVVVAFVGLTPVLGYAQAGMVGVGVLGALMAPATLALVADLANDASRGVAIGGFNAAGSLGFLAGIVGGGYVADEYGYTEAFAVAGGAELALAAIALPALVKLRR